MFALTQIVRELVHGTRDIVTNLAVYPERLESYLRERGHEVDLANRLRVVERRDPRIKTWWRLRGRQGDFGEFGGPEWEGVEGVFYVIDEGQDFYSAREWATSGPELTKYLAQNRKAGDDTLICTPSTTLIDKQIRSVSNECVVLENWYRKRFKLFRPPGRLHGRVYWNCPPAPSEEAWRTFAVHVEPQKLAKCYDTAAGAGIVGTTADVGKGGPGGLPWWTILIAIVCVAAAVHFLFRGALRLVPGQKRHEVATHSTNVLVAASPGGRIASPPVAALIPPRVSGPDPVQISGLCKGSEGWVVTSRSGYSQSARQVTDLGWGEYLVDGRRCTLAVAARSSSSVKRSLR